MIKKTVMALLAVAGIAAAYAAEMPRSEWLAKVGDCAQDAALLKQTIGQLSAADQPAFLAEVNAAIAKMPGSDEVKGAQFLAANRAAVTGATPEARSAVLAEVFATVPPEHMPVIVENFSSDLFNRNSDPSKKYTDAQYTAICTATMTAIAARCATAENSAVREAFAAVMFERGAGGSVPGLRDSLVATLPAASQETAKNEWLPAALGDGREQSYNPLLGAAGAGEEPNHAAVLQLSGLQSSQAILADMQSGASAGNGAYDSGIFSAPGIVGTAESYDLVGAGLSRIPRSYVFSKTPIVTPILDGNGNIVTDPQGREMYTTPDGQTVYKDTDPSGNTVYVDGNGNVVSNSYGGGKHRGKKEDTPYDDGTGSNPGNAPSNNP